MLSFERSHPQGHLVLENTKFQITLELDRGSKTFAIAFHQPRFLLDFAHLVLDFIQGNCSSLDLVLPHVSFTLIVIYKILQLRDHLRANIQLLDDHVTGSFFG